MSGRSVKRWGRTLLAVSFSASVVGLRGPGPLTAQTPAAAKGSVAVGVVMHHGKFGNWGSGGIGLSAATWIRLASFAAVRTDVSYAYKVGGTEHACNGNELPCPPGAPKHVPTGSVGVMLGNLASPFNRYYVVAGPEVMYLRNHGSAPSWILVPKLGAGILLPERAFVELSGRWRADWGNRPMRHILLVLGWSR